MASLHQQKGDRPGWKIRFRDTDGRQRVLWLGKLTVKAARDVFRHVDELLRCRDSQTRLDEATEDWLRKLEGKLRDRLEALGLLTKAGPVRDLPRTVLGYMRAYIESRTDWKKPENYRQAVDKLERFLGRDMPLAGLTKGEAERWHRWMIDSLEMSPNTAGQNVKRCRQMMAAAIDDGLVKANPFKGVKIDLRSDGSKNRFIDGATARALLDACPDQEWRTLFALCRYGGLRCPSEVLRVRWSDIAWDRGRFKVRAPKTERYGKGERVVPLFPELLAELDTLFAMVQPGVDCPADSFVIQSYRSTETNLRAAMHRIADVASVERWPKPFMALRASRRTELERTGRFPNHVLNDWFGHSGAIAETHYLQTTEDDYQEAIGGNAGGNIRTHSESPRAIMTQKNPGKTGVAMAADGGGQPLRYTRRDSNP